MQIGPIPPGAAPEATPARPQNVPEAAQQFESLLIGQMLENMRIPEDSEDQAQGTMWSLAAQQFAQVLSKNGGFGISKLIAAGLERKP